MALTKPQQIFIQNYITSNNATESSRIAYPKNKNPEQRGYQVLRNAEVQTEIDRLTKEIAESLQITTEWITKRIQEIALEGNNNEKLRALELLGKWKGLFKEQVVNVALFSDVSSDKMLSSFKQSQARLTDDTIDVSVNK